MATGTNIPIQRLLDDLRAGRRVALARTISIVEDGRAGYRDLLRALHPLTGRAHRIGLTGPPGAGKSSLTAALIERYRGRDETVGVVAVDPSSPFTGGALLGDRIRMNDAATDRGVFIRSMATRGSLGGLALTTREVADVMDAFGFDRILLETVGVGQSELDIAAAADTTVVVLTPESGDSVQAMKAGLMEISDVFVVNKADRPGAERLAREIEMQLHLKAGRTFRRVPAHHGVDFRRAAARTAPPEAAHDKVDEVEDGNPWDIPVLRTSAESGDGVDELHATLDRHRAWLRTSGEGMRRQRERTEQRVRQAVEREIRERAWAVGQEMLEASRLGLESGAETPYEVAERIVRAVTG